MKQHAVTTAQSNIGYILRIYDEFVIYILHFQASVFGCSKVVDNAQAHSISWTLNAIITQLQSTNRWFHV